MVKVTDIAAGYENDAWLGFGYLGDRRHALEAIASGEWPRERADQIAAADAAAVEAANAQGWTPQRFFEWLNSKNGRWYSDMTIGSAEDPAAMAARYVK